MYSRRYGYSPLLWTSMLSLDVFFSSEWVLSYGLLCNFVCDRNCRNLCSLNIPVLCFCMLWHIVETTTCPLHHHYMSMNCVQSNCSTTASCIFTCVAKLCLGGIWRRTHLSNLGLHSFAVHKVQTLCCSFFESRFGGWLSSINFWWLLLLATIVLATRIHWIFEQCQHQESCFLSDLYVTGFSKFHLWLSSIKIFTFLNFSTTEYLFICVEFCYELSLVCVVLHFVGRFYKESRAQ